MKLLLHIGTEKTGTTLLQQWLYANKAALSQQGVFLSDLMGKPNNRKLVAYFMQGMDDFMKREKIRSAAEKAQYFQGFEDSLVAEIAQARQSHDVMIISSEHFHSRLVGQGEVEALAAFLSRHFSEIKVLCYFREQASMRESLYSTGLRTATTTALDAFDAGADEDRYYYNFFRIATRWSEVFGRAACDFRIYDRAAFAEGDLRRDFLTAVPCALETVWLDFAVERSNESLSLLKGRVCQTINALVPYWAPAGGLNPANRFFKTLIDRCGTLKVGRILDGQKQDFSASFSNANRRFFETFLPQSSGFPKGGSEERRSADLPIAQVAEIVDDLSGTLINGVKDRLLLDRDADVLRTVALKYESGQRLTQEEAVALMELAARARPGGKFIKKKLGEWTKTT